MDQLSSCYFCGDALDASLEEHPVVPDALDPASDTQRTVVLCPTCKRKLDAVLESVVAAADRPGGAGGTGAPDDGAANDIESTLGDDEDVLRSVGDDAEPDPSTGEESEMQWGGEDADEVGAGASAGSDDGAPDDGASEETTDGEERTYTSSRRAGYTREHDRKRTASEDGTDAAGSGADGESGDGETADGESGDGDREGEPDVSLTRLENTKVMRLLKNREFPVERDDFVTVASSAYEVSPRDCDKVIDLAVEHDLLREESGQLYAGSRWG